MGFQRKLQYFLVHEFQLSNKVALSGILAGRYSVNNQVVFENVLITETDSIVGPDGLIRAGKQFRYFRFYKPCGFESSLNEKVANNIRHFFIEPEGLSIAGRLDKASEGLLLLSDNGKWVEAICNPLENKLKTYEVELDLEPEEAFLFRFRTGVIIGGEYQTKACVCEKIGPRRILVRMTEGKNRQIRRMCHKLGYQVLSLKRIQIATWALDGLNPGESSPIKP